MSDPAAVATDLASRLSKVTRDLGKIVAEVGSATSTTSSYWNDVARRLSVQYEKARSIMSEWVKSNLPDVYDAKVREAVQDVKDVKVSLSASVSGESISTSSAGEATKESLLKEALDSLYTGLDTGEQTLRELLHATQQTLIKEEKVNKALAEGYEYGGSTGAAQRRLRDELLAKALDGKYITVVDKNGDEIHYQVDTYAELVARVKLMEAASAAVLDTAAAVGADLVQVSSHNTQCLECAEYEGKIFSLSGDDPDFPQLEEEPPFHPNCQHSLTVVFKEALALDGSLSRYVEESSA